MTPTRFFVSNLTGGIGLVLGVLLALLGGEEAEAQDGPSLRSVDRSVRVSVDPVAQYYETSGGQGITQLSTYLNASVPIGQRFLVQARAGYARTGGKQLTDVRGLTDATGRIQYAQPTGDGSVVVSATVNVPVGKDKLSKCDIGDDSCNQAEEDELRTTRLASRNFYDFRVSSYSRGLAVSPRITWAHSISDQLAIGIGAGYQYQRGFQPNEGLSSDSLYVPGDGMSIKGGADYKLTATSALGVDLSFRRYGTDEVGGTRRFNSGNQISGTARYLRRSGFTRIRIVARYANWDESEFGYRFGDDGPERDQVLPSHTMLLGGYKTRLTEGIDARIRISGHHYAETIQADRKIFGRLYVSPSFEVGEWVVVSPHGTATYGSFLGLGGGIRIGGTF